MAADDAGANLYVTARTAGATGSALAVFSRDAATGALTEIECFSAPGNTEDCTSLGASSSDSPMIGLVDVVVSHDGKNVYGVSSARSAVVEWSRASNGSLTYIGCVTSPALSTTGCSTALGLNTATAITIDPADASVYVAGFGASMIGVLQRAFGGTLLQQSVGGVSPWCVSSNGADDSGLAGKCLTDGLLVGPHHVQVSPSASQLFVAAQSTSAIIGYSRNPSRSLTLSPGVCVNVTGSGGCSTVLHLNGVDHFDISADGSRLYAAGRNDLAVVVIDRNVSTGALIAHTNTADACWRNVLITPNCGYQDALLQPYDVKIAKDGKSVYVSTVGNNSIVQFDVQADGGLVPKPAPFGCIYGGDFPLCMNLPINSPVEGLATAGRSLYAALNNGGGGDRLLAWSIDRPPVCNPFSAPTPFNTPITLMLACTDADGDTLTYSATTPVQGTLGAPQANGSISYAPQLNTVGDDTFSFNATETLVTNPAGTGTHPSATIGAGPTTATVQVAKGIQSITFGSLVAKTFGDPDFAASASASSSLPVSFAATGNCTISGVTVHISGAGSCTVTASQSGNATYDAAADVSQAFVIAKASQTITFGVLSDKTLGAADFSVSASASSGLGVSFAASGSCTVSSATVHLSGAGSCSVTASQAGNANYSAATPVSQSFTITKPVVKCTVPNVVGKKLTAAKLALKRRHCRAGTISYAYSKKAKGLVSSQRPRAGRVLAAGTKVKLVISRGRRP